MRILFACALLLSVVSPRLESAERARSPLTQLMIRQEYQVLPLDFERPNRLILRAKVVSRPLRALVDTGMGWTLVSEDHARGLKRTGALMEPVFGLFGGSTTRVERVIIDRLQLLPLSFTNEPAKVLDLPQQRETHTGSWISLPQGPQLPGLILGMDFLERHYALLNCRAPCLYLRNAPPPDSTAEELAKALTGSGMVAVSLQMEGRFLLSALVNDRPALFLLDTGCPFTEIDRNQLADLKLEQEQALGKQLDLTRHQDELQFTDIVSLKIGSFERKHLRAGVVSLKETNAARQRHGLAPLQGLLAMDVLYPACALIDYANHRLFVAPSPQQ